MKTKYLPIVSLLVFSASAEAAVLALYGNTNAGGTAASSTSPTSQSNAAAAVANLTTSSISGSGLNGNFGSFFLRNQFGANLWITGSSPSGAGSASSDLWIGVNNQNWGTVGAAVSSAHYLEFTLTADVGKTLDLTNLTFSWQTGINNQTSILDFGYQLFASSNGGSYASVGSAGTKSVSNALGTSTDWGTHSSENIDINALDGANTVTFRLAMSNPINTTAGSYVQFFRDVTVNGSVVPEPSAALLGCMGLMVLCRRRRD
jgi:hypothetical protein